MRKVLKWLSILFGGLLVLAIVIIVFIYFSTETSLNKVYNISAPGVHIPAQPELGERKYPLVVVDLCRDCHGNDLAGQVMDDDPLLGRLVSTNLTAGKGGIRRRLHP